MKELITVTVNEQGQQLVSARELYEVLVVNEGKNERFSQWFKRHLQYGFEKDVDFTSVKIFTVVNNGAKRQLDDYAMTINMAKELSMLQKSDKGREVRKYFLQCEKQLLSPTRTLRQLKGEALMDIIEAKSVDDRVLAVGKYGDLCKQEAIEEVQPTLDYHDKVLKSDKLVTMTDVAKDLGMSARKLNSLLNDLGVQYKKGKTWHLYSKYEGLVPSHFDYHITEFGQILKVSEEGRKWIINLLEENNVIAK